MKIQQNISLLPYNTMAIGAIARQWAAFSTTDELLELLQQTPAQTPLLVLGGGSNILFTKDFDGLVLKNELEGIETIAEDEHYVYVKAGAGENWHGFVQHCLQHNFAGAENLSLIPGNVGASPMQNIGAYGVELMEIFHELEALHIKEKTIRRFTRNDCQFGYRESVFKRKYKNQYIILNVTYRLRKTAQLNTTYGAIEKELENMGVQQPTIQAVAQAVINIRQSKLPDPKQIGNAGSFFKNPSVPAPFFQELQKDFPGIVGYPNVDGTVKLAAGWLIEQAGWKGVRRGDAGCHARQALVLVNYGQATGKDIYDLSEEILQSIQQKYGVQLEREVNII